MTFLLIFLLSSLLLSLLPSFLTSLLPYFLTSLLPYFLPCLPPSMHPPLPCLPTSQPACFFPFILAYFLSYLPVIIHCRVVTLIFRSIMEDMATARSTTLKFAPNSGVKRKSSKINSPDRAVQAFVDRGNHITDQNGQPPYCGPALSTWSNIGDRV